MRTNKFWGIDAPAMKPIRPQVLAVIVSIVIVVLVDGVFELPSHAASSAIGGLSGIAGYLVGKGTDD